RRLAVQDQRSLVDRQHRLAELAVRGDGIAGRRGNPRDIAPLAEDRLQRRRLGGLLPRCCQHKGEEGNQADSKAHDTVAKHAYSSLLWAESGYFFSGGFGSAGAGTVPLRSQTSIRPAVRSRCMPATSRLLSVLSSTSRATTALLSMAGGTILPALS